ncbi:MAG: hypothetical protein K2J75_06505, partial [Clostridia bacterium]|nr:hypothetical protein [Clostridia bacterium]
VIPMHFKTSRSVVDIEKLDEFIDLFDEEQIRRIDGQSIEFDRAHFDSDSTVVVVFDQEVF